MLPSVVSKATLVSWLAAASLASTIPVESTGTDAATTYNAEAPSLDPPHNEALSLNPPEEAASKNETHTVTVQTAYTIEDLSELPENSQFALSMNDDGQLVMTLVDPDAHGKVYSRGAGSYEEGEQTGEERAQCHSFKIATIVLASIFGGGSSLVLVAVCTCGTCVGIANCVEKAYRRRMRATDPVLPTVGQELPQRGRGGGQDQWDTETIS